METKDSEKLWTCTCGTKNFGKFCSSCGKSKEMLSGAVCTSTTGISATNKQEDELELQMRKDAYEAEKRRKRAEFDKKIKDYNETRAQVPMQELKKWSSSPLVAILTIMITITTLARIVSILTTLNNGVLALIIKGFQVLLSVVLCVGSWRLFIAGKSNEKNYNTAGIRLINGAIQFYQVITYLIMGLILLLAFLILFIGKSCVNDLENDVNTATDGNLSISSFNASFTSLLVVLVIAVIVVFVIFIVYYTSLRKYVGRIISCFEMKIAPRQSSTTTSLLLFIVGIIYFSITITSLVGTDFLNELLNYSVDSVDWLQSVNDIVADDTFNVIAEFANVFTYILAGIIVIQSNNLESKINNARDSLEEPKPNF
jgi:hypothetical protein